MKKSTKVTCLGFLTIMLLLTFFSKTIYRTMLPNVDVMTLKSGSLNFAYSTTEYTLNGEAETSLYFRFSLPSALRVDKVFVKENEKVENGQALIQFYEPSASFVYKQVKQKRDAAYIAWRSWLSEYKNAKIAVYSKIALADDDSDMEAAIEEFALLQDGIMNNTTEALMYSDYLHFSDMADALSALAADNWIMRASYDALVGEIVCKHESEYAGLTPILSLIPLDTNIGILVNWSQFPKDYSTNWKLSAIITCETGKLNGKIVDIWKTDTQTQLTLITEGVCDFSEITQVSLLLESSYQPLLISNTVLREGKCYMLEQRISAWGEKEYFARGVLPVLGASDGTHTVVKEGLSAGNLIISTSSKPINDGQTVVISLP